jgi:short-subunit dehydrogenase
MTNFNTKYGPWAVVTGASSGIGAELARQLAASGLNVVLVARGAQRLDALAEQLRNTYRVRVRSAAIDLTDRSFLARLREATDDIDVGLLVNNAGRWEAGRFLDNDIQREVDTVDLNVTAPLILAHEFGRRFKARGGGGMIFLSSVVALQGTPYVANYAATKAYDLLFAEALSYELEPYGIDVLAVLPGPVDTEGAENLDFSKLPLKVATAEQVARKSLRKLGRARKTIPGALNNFIAATTKLAPRSTNTNLMGRLFAPVALNDNERRQLTAGARRK